MWYLFLQSGKSRKGFTVAQSWLTTDLKKKTCIAPQPYLVEVEWRQGVSAHSFLLGVAAILQRSVFGHEEAHPGAGGGGRVLTRQEEANQHPRDLVIVQGSSVS